MSERPESHDRRVRAYWRANRVLIAVLLIVWAIVSFGFSILLIEPLNAVKLGRLPLGFWFAQQGSILTFVALIFIYATVMDRLDRKHGFGSAAEPAEKPEAGEGEGGEGI